MSWSYFLLPSCSGVDEVMELDRRPSSASKAGSNASRFETLKGFFVVFVWKVWSCALSSHLSTITFLSPVSWFESY